MAMTVAQLRAALAGYPDEYLVVLARDSEGNSLSPCEGVQRGAYEPENTWSGDFWDAGEALAYGMSLNAVCLWPVN